MNATCFSCVCVCSFRHLHKQQNCPDWDCSKAQCLQEECSANSFQHAENGKSHTWSTLDNGSAYGLLRNILLKMRLWEGTQKGAESTSGCRCGHQPVTHWPLWLLLLVSNLKVASRSYFNLGMDFHCMSWPDVNCRAQLPIHCTQAENPSVNMRIRRIYLISRPTAPPFSQRMFIYVTIQRPDGLYEKKKKKSPSPKHLQSVQTKTDNTAFPCYWIISF